MCCKLSGWSNEFRVIIEAGPSRLSHARYYAEVVWVHLQQDWINQERLQGRLAEFIQLFDQMLIFRDLQRANHGSAWSLMFQLAHPRRYQERSLRWRPERRSCKHSRWHVEFDLTRNNEQTCWLNFNEQRVFALTFCSYHDNWVQTHGWWVMEHKNFAFPHHRSRRLRKVEIHQHRRRTVERSRNDQ